MRDTKLIKSSLFILNVYFFGFGISVEEENKNDEFQSNITGMESSKRVGDIFEMLSPIFDTGHQHQCSPES